MFPQSTNYVSKTNHICNQGRQRKSDNGEKSDNVYRAINKNCFKVLKDSVSSTRSVVS